MYRSDGTDPRISLNLSDKLVNSVQWQFCVERLGDSMFLGRSITMWRKLIDAKD